MQPSRLIRSILVGLLAIFIASPALAGHLAPRDACHTFANSDAFQTKLATAVANRNADILQEIVDPQVLLDFGGGSGWEEMRLRLTSPEYNLWEELDTVIRLGCAVGYQKSMVMPYYWGQDFGDLDAFDTYVVLGDSVPLFSSVTGEEVIGHLNWEAVELSAYFEDGAAMDQSPRWEVQTRSGERGFVDQTRLRALFDYRLIAEQSNGRWRITTFIAGD